MTPQDLENKYNFEYPQLYKLLYLDGMLDWGEYNPNWYSEVYPKLKENPPLLLHTFDFELLDQNSVAEEIEVLTDPEGYRKINKELRFIPFAKSSGGDHYCFFLNEENNSDVPIVFVWHDLNEVEYLGKNLQDFIFRSLLMDMSYKDKDVTDLEFKNDTEAVFTSHKKYLTDQQNYILQSVKNREIKDYEISYPNTKVLARGFLTYEETDKYLNEIIPFDKMDTSFEYSTE